MFVAKHLQFLLLALSGIAIAGCQTDPTVVDTEPHIIGVITNVDRQNSAYVTLVVDALLPADLPYGAELRVTQDTPVIVRRPNGSRVTWGGTEHFTVGSSIRAWTTGVWLLKGRPVAIATRVEAILPPSSR
jgi:hypothetical protein